MLLDVSTSRIRFPKATHKAFAGGTVISKADLTRLNEFLKAELEPAKYSRLLSENINFNPLAATRTSAPAAVGIIKASEWTTVATYLQSVPAESFARFLTLGLSFRSVESFKK